jgi:signal transduction histidine kinase
VRPRRLGTQVLPALVVAVLVIALGSLQYRWLRQVGDAERTRLRQDAQRRVDALAQDFDREVTRAYVMLQVPPGPRSAAPDAFAERWRRWQARAPHPDIVSAVYLLEPPASPAAVLRFDPASGAFVRSEWPAALETLQRLARSAAEDKAPPPMPVLADVPALVSPVPDVIALGPAPRAGVPGADPGRVLFQRRLGPWPSWSCTVVVLDRERLVRLLSELATRHLAGADGPEYDVTLLPPRGAPRWSSGTPRARGDAEAAALQVRFDDLERSLLDGLGDEKDARFGPAHFRVRLATGVVVGASGARDHETAAWRLVLAHRAGSVDALATALRRRNLAVSFGMLGLLAASMALVVASSQRARRLAARQMEFVAGVSHELRTPVAVIRSAAENLADGVVSDPAQVRRYGGVIRDQGARLTGMVDQVLALAGAQAGSRAPQRIAAAELVRAALEDHDRELRAAGVPLQVEVAADLPDLGGDADALRRALGNLVANARRHAQGSALRVSARQAGDGTVQIEVEDQGPGIDPADLPHVFEPFYRGRRAVAEQVPGSGLGLAVVRGVTEAHGGTVSVRSRPGGGATFTLRLPARAR